MSRLLHQLGHRYSWNLESLAQAGTGDGVIVGPRYIERAKVLALPVALRGVSLFDPQFYLPHSAQGKLSTYPFFPQVISGGFSTTEWNDELQAQCADACLAFQHGCGFEHLTIPCRFYEGMPSDFIEKQDAQFVQPFLEAAQRLDSGRSLVLQLITTDQMIRDEEYRTELLNWVTSYPELHGVYLIYHVHNRRKQIDDIDFLIGLLRFCTALRASGLNVFVGYCNTEAMLLACAGVEAVSIGAYENLRMFSTKAFEEKDDSVRRGPNARVYVPRLLQWIEHEYLGAIRQVVGSLDDYIEDNEHRVAMFSPSYNWHFTKPDPYKHYFRAFTTQFRRICLNEGEARIAAVFAECQQAMVHYDELQHAGIVFDSESAGAHLPRWLTTINLWRNNP